MSNSDQPDKRRSSDRPDDAGDQGRTGDPNASEFGSFVSSSVRNSFRQLKPEAERTNPKPAATPAARPAAKGRSRPTSDPQAVPRDAAVESRPVGRKWRDAVGGAIPRPADKQTLLDDQPESSDGRPPFDPGDWFRHTFFDETGPTRKFLALIGAAIVIILLIVFLWLQGGGDDGGNDDDVTPTATNSSVITTDRTSTPPVNQASTPPGPDTRETPGATATTGVIVGGDNQRDEETEEDGN